MGTNLIFPQGTDLEGRIPNVRDASGDPITNWTGFSVKGQVRDPIESTTVLHEWSSQGASPNARFEASDIVLSVDNATSTDWLWRRARYDVELTDPQGRVARIAEGHVIISREVTR